MARVGTPTIAVVQHSRGPSALVAAAWRDGELDEVRANAAQAVVAELRPDVVVLNEALFCQAYGGQHVDYGALFGFPYQAVALYDEAWGNAILSRFPIVGSHQMRVEQRGGLVARLQTPQGPLTVASYHPHPSREPALKGRDFTRLVQGLRGPLIVGGDMNCLHPEDGPDRNALVEAFRAFSDEPEASVDRFIDSGVQVFEALAALGLRDAVPAAGRRYTIPTDLLRSDKASAMRIDHILCNDAVRVVGGEVVHSAASNRASDHHPVMVDFELAA